MSKYRELATWATVRQLELIEAIEKHGSTRKAAVSLGMNVSGVSQSMRSLQKRAARMGYSPKHDMTHPVPDGYMVKGVSTYYDKDGKAAGQWVKSSADQKRQAELMQAAIAAMSEEIVRVKPAPAPAHVSKHLCNLFTLTDSHVGMRAWHRENGEGDWDLGIAESVLVGCFEHMVNSAPTADVAFVNQLGDFLHSDGLSPVTPTSHHVLDQDGRFGKVVSVAIRIIRRIVSLALAKHSRVVLLLAEGNHDMASSVWLRAMFAALYENEPRVEVISSEMPYYAYKHGKTMLAFHHGHMKRNDDLPLLFAAQFARMWGETTKRYCHVGHRHHVEEKDHSGMRVIQHATLAARDAYASRGGWISERQAEAMTFHTEFGIVSRIVSTPEMLAA